MTVEKVVSVSRARKILGKLAHNLTDTQVIEIINALRLLAREQLVYNGSKDSKLSDDTNNSFFTK